MPQISADSHAFRRQGQASQRRPALQCLLHGVGDIGHEMIRDACGVPSRFLEMLPQRPQLWPGDAADAGKQAKLHRIAPLKIGLSAEA